MLFDKLVDHLRVNYLHHVAAGSGSIFDFLFGGNAIHSITVGVSIWCITKLLNILLEGLQQWIKSKKKT